MNVTESINGRRSVRSFANQAIPADIIDQLVTLGTKAATGSGQQAWGFVIITDKNDMKRLSDEIKKYLGENLEKYPYLQQYKNWINDENYNVFYDAPCLLIIYGDTNSHWYVYDCTLAAGNIMLASVEYGLGTCWIGFAECICDTAAFKSKYNIPEFYKLVCPMVMGYPTAPLSPLSRKPATIFYRG